MSDPKVTDQHRDEAHALAWDNELCFFGDLDGANDVVHGEHSHACDAITEFAATIRAKGRSEGLREAARMARKQAQEHESITNMESLRDVWEPQQYRADALWHHEEDILALLGEEPKDCDVPAEEAPMCDCATGDCNWREGVRCRYQVLGDIVEECPIPSGRYASPSAGQVAGDKPATLTEAIEARRAEWRAGAAARAPVPDRYHEGLRRAAQILTAWAVSREREATEDRRNGNHRDAEVHQHDAAVMKYCAEAIRAELPTAAPPKKRTPVAEGNHTDLCACVWDGDKECDCDGRDAPQERKP